MTTLLKQIALGLGALVAIAAAGDARGSEAGPGSGPWQIAAPEQQGFDPALLERVGDAVGAIAGRQGLVIVNDGVLIYEDYWSTPYHQATPAWRNTSFSSAKSWGSALVGVAITRGLFDADTEVGSLHPAADSGFRPGTLVRHLLTMSSGGTLVIKPSTRRPKLKTENPAPGRSIDYLRVIKPEIDTPEGYGTSLRPGMTFYYDGEPADHLANVIAAASGMPAKAFSEKYLLSPLGVENFNYQPEGVDSDGNIRMAGSIELSVRDMARLGQLWLNGGRWDGKQLIDARYVAEAVQPSPLNPSYGFLWWLNTDGRRIPGAPTSLYYAAGAFGQYLFVFPDDDLVIATMGYQPERVPDVAQLIWQAIDPLVSAAD